MRLLTPPTRSAPPPLGTVSRVAEGTHARGTAFNQQWGQGHAGGRGWRTATAAAPAAGKRAFSSPAHPAAAGGGPRRAAGEPGAGREWEATQPSAGARGWSLRPLPGSQAAGPALGRHRLRPHRSKMSRAARPRPPRARPPPLPRGPQSGRWRTSRAGDRGRRPRHLASPRPARFPGFESRPARTRTGAAWVLPFRRFEFPPARRVRRNTRMVIAGLFAPILKKAERSSAGASQSAGLLPSFGARSQHLPRKSRGFFLLAQPGGPECSAEAAY
ncbi:transmembrane protein 187 isoform X1 [Gorilla gorilla gorilla]|uniref:transmembrane protein 187 isoform X1 n=1 Tax=Gorilla gorilla gorilla TaxID=9595 RepID=UPI00300A080C